MTNQPQARRFGQILRLPVVQQVVDDRKEALLGWVPGLREVMIQMGLVDALHGGIDVRIGCEQDAPSHWIYLARLGEHLGALQSRHPLIADHDGQ